MDTRDHRDVIRSLMEHYCMDPGGVVYAESVYEWCAREGVDEPDRQKPLRLITRAGERCRMVVMERIPDAVVEERVRAMGVRGALQNAALDRAAMLNSDKKRLAYLFISEYATSMPDIEGDPLLIDNWAFDEMKKLGFFLE
jgi:hypothetical protein